MIHELVSYERRSYLLYLSSQIQSTGPAIQTVKSIFDGQMSREETKSHLSSEKAAFQRDECRELLQVTNAYMNISLLAFYVSKYQF